MQTNYDVVVVGGGLVGLVFTALLAKQEFKVALVDAGPLKSAELELPQLRVSAINPACQHILDQINVWPKLDRYCAFEKMHVWDSCGRGEIQFDCTDIGASSLGYIVENAVLQNALFEELSVHSNVTMFPNAQPLAMALKPQSSNSTETFIALQLSDQEISAKLLVGSDGGHSWVRRYAHIDCHEWSYDHEALVTTVKTEMPHQDTAWQCFTPSGPLALLPMHNKHTCSVVWSGLPDDIGRLKQLDDAAFNAEISRAFEYKLGNIVRISQQVIVPLTMRHAKEYVSTRLALIGDAAHTIHPLAGQGVNLGFMDALVLANAITTARLENKDWGNNTLLSAYQRQRKSDNWLMIVGMEIFKRLFQTKSALLVNSRSLGLNAVNHMDYLKNKFIYHATGLNSKPSCG